MKRMILSVAFLTSTTQSFEYVIPAMQNAGAGVVAGIHKCKDVLYQLSTKKPAHITASFAGDIFAPAAVGLCVTKIKPTEDNFLNCTLGLSVAGVLGWLNNKARHNSEEGKNQEYKQNLLHSTLYDQNTTSLRTDYNIGTQTGQNPADKIQKDKKAINKEPLKAQVQAIINNNAASINIQDHEKTTINRHVLINQLPLLQKAVKKDNDTAYTYRYLTRRVLPSVGLGAMAALLIQTPTSGMREAVAVSALTAAGAYTIGSIVAAYNPENREAKEERERNALNELSKLFKNNFTFNDNLLTLKQQPTQQS